MKAYKYYALASVVVGAFGMASAHAETISVVVKDTTSPYWQTVMAGACNAGKELNATVNVTGPTSEADIAGQISILENAVSTGSQAILLAPSSSDGLGAAVDEAGAKVPVFLIDSAANSTAFKSLIATDNKAGGVLAGKALAEAIKKKNGAAKGTVAIISYGPGINTLDERIAGFKEGLAETPEIEIVTTRVGDFQTTTALNQANDVLSAFPQLDGIYADALFTGIGSAQAISEAGRKGNPVLVTFDSSDTLEQNLRDGVVQALVVQNPYKMGYDGIANALKSLKGEDVPARIDTGVTVITSDNVDSAEAKSLLHPDFSCLQQ
ncbi:ABC transporter substrate-binding protein [Shinella pollutisoli]|uniref:ABC transporter substrate-binding protein n=1 Tax=Shinella pollutisoli TaxID=2250594 RepID=A0ABV7DGU1_9HYPH|nr:ABC transporter substrate-binding protein [Shinella pollutisoli]